MSKILHFYSENFKRLKVVEFNPNANLVLVSGKNGQGKSSVLDSIWSALQYKASKANNISPVRHGEDRAEVTLEIDDYVIQRIFDPDGETRLRIETKEGLIVKSPQALLDKICGSLSFDPLAFSNAKDSDKRTMLEDIFKLNLAEFEAKDAALKEERKDIKRELEMVEGQMTAIRPPEHNDPATETTASDLIQKFTDLITASKRFDAIEIEIKNLEEQILSLQAKKASLLEESFNLHAEYKLEDRVNQAANLKEQIANIEARNARARQVQNYIRLRKRYDDLKGSLDISNKKIELNKIEREEKIEEANLPIPGLEIREDGVFVNDTPFPQLSGAERIKISTAIAMAANPDLRVIRITDGSLLDEDSMRVLATMAQENDYQVWVEIVSNNDKIGVVIEDGSIKKIN